MNFIRTTDATGKPLKKPEAEPPRLTEKQLQELNNLTRRIEQEYHTTPERLIALRDGVDRLGLEKSLRANILTGTVKAAYLDRNTDFNRQQATTALQIFNRASRADAAGMVDSWEQEGSDAGDAE